VVRVGNRWVLYFSGRHGSVRRRDGPTLCIGAAVAADPAGPFVPQEKPLLCEGFPHGVIDATVFPDGGRLWMIAKTDGNCCNVPTRFVTVPLAADGLSLAGAPTPIAGIAADQPWEGSVVEAPTMLRPQGALYLFYSANHFGGGSYGVGYARCESVTGPCTDAPENPILSSASARVGPLVGPGHQSVFEAGGRTMIAYHGWVATRGWRKARGTSARALFIDEIRWANGRPVIHRAP
jgi:beta-xylosidase